MQNKPLISVITPLYNAKDHIEDTIKSVLNQTYQNWEMIIVDDVSNDGGNEIVSRHALLDSRIKLIQHTVNKGGAGARNTALELANGRLIAFLDADDLWDPEKLELQSEFMLTNNIGFSFSNYRTMDEDGRFLNNVDVPSKVKLSDMYYHNYIGCLTAMYDVNFFGKFYLPDIRKRQDYALWIKMLAHYDFAHSINSCLASYRIRKSSLSSSKIDAVKYYWKVLYNVANLSLLASSYYTCVYVILTFMKKKIPFLYKKILIKR